MRRSSLSILQFVTGYQMSYGMVRSGFKDRVRRAHLARQTEIGRELEQDEIGRAVAAYLGIQEAIGQGTVSRWFRGSIPDLPTIAALARTLNVDPGWLAFNDLSDAPKPWWAATPVAGESATPATDAMAELVEEVERAEAREESHRRKPGDA